MAGVRPRIGIYEMSAAHSGLTRYVLGILDALPAGRFDVTLFCHPRAPYAPHPGVRLVPISLPTSSPSSAGVAGSAAPPRRSAGPAAASRLWRSLAPPGVRYAAGFARNAARIARCFRRAPVDLLHTNECGCMESVLAARLAGVPKVLATYHTDSAYDRLDGRLTAGYRALERATNRLLDRAIAVSEVTRSDRVRHCRIPGPRVVTVHNGIDPDRFARPPDPASARTGLGLPTDRLLIGGVGQLSRYKGYDVLIRAFAGVAGRHPRADLVIAGTGPLREELEALADRLGVRGRVHFLGFQPDVPRVLAALDVYVLASLCEALPYALLEAMAAGLPVLATAVGGVPEVVEEGVSGLLVAPGRADAMAEALGRLADSAAARARMGSAARERVGRHFHQRDSARRTVAVYQQMLGAGG